MMTTLVLHWTKPIPAEMQAALLNTRTDTEYSPGIAEGSRANAVTAENFVYICKGFFDNMKANALFLDESGHVAVGIIGKFDSFLAPLVSAAMIADTLQLKTALVENNAMKTLFLAPGVTLPVRVRLRDGSDIEIRNEGVKVVVEFVRRAA